jgi:hypothetical protein
VAFIFGVLSRKGPPVDPKIIDAKSLVDGNARIGDLVELVGGCPRFPGDACDLVGGYKSVVCVFNNSLYYRIVA